MKIQAITTGYTLVSSATPNRSTHRWKYAYTGLFQRRSKRIKVPVKCYYVKVNGHSVLIDAGWSKEVVEHPMRHLGFGLWFASEPVMKQGESAKEQLEEMGRFPGVGNDNPLQYSCLGNPVDRGAGWATAHGVTKRSDTTPRLNDKQQR